MLLENVMTEIYDTQEAADYLGLTVAGVKYHVYKVGDLVPDKRKAHTLIFTQETLDAFKENRRPVGRPPDEEAPKN